MSDICQSLLSNFFEEGVAASADPGLESMYKYRFVRIYYISISKFIKKTLIYVCI